MDNNIIQRNYELLCRALSAQKPAANKYIEQFSKLIYEDFKNFCDREPNINDAVPMRQLLEIQTEMQKIANCPRLHTKTIGALGGGFSTGKSSFINSVLGSTVQLAVDTTVATAIPCYVMADTDTKIQGVNYNGGVFDIPFERFKEISHKMLKSFNFNIKDIITYTTVMSPMNEKYFKNLCLIDTPGYNPPQSKGKKRDYAIAKEYIKDADFLIWFIAVDTNGTFPESDLEFLKTLEFGKNENKQLYISANKAEVKPLHEIEEIVEDFKVILEDEDLEYSGITAYSSIRKKIILADQEDNDIFHFLEKNNKINNIYSSFSEKLYDTFKGYIQEIINDSNLSEELYNHVNNIYYQYLKVNSNAIENDNDTCSESFNYLFKCFKPKDRNSRMKDVINLREKFKKCINEFCNAMGIEVNENKYCPKCGQSLPRFARFCSNCKHEF